MKNIPHDFYLKFLDQKVYDDTLNFHTKGNFTTHECVRNISCLHNFQPQLLGDLTGNELQLYPDMDITLEEHALENLSIESPLHRDHSCDFFDGTTVDFELIKQVVKPLLTKSTNSSKRGYPSAGALYPVEVFCCSLSSSNIWPCPEKVLHLLPSSRKFEILQGSQETNLLMEAILPTGNSVGNPSHAIIYMMYLPKTLFKYRYRGYRLALMETGSMYMLVDLQCKAIKLKSRPWSGYTDNMVCRALSLNPTLFYPSCIQLIGGKK
ncbi:SagB/ThcOx family dehydrogenase [Pseudomonas sp. C1C7]|uniref:SagB/ThcOx family dehydrogenase n=1 Tax=Pseudomonas sp. C1C7 TaxID=2735272 RepID=UPI001586C49A|nr:SagB/ThcOx family dehydrogenase [Pseudomonas sp. C1C7]NUT78562.1 SagB/ThcOx family dehydrogenase [Pseudomonas sp. C1C7]